MTYSSKIIRAIGVCVLSAAFCLPCFARLRYVPTAQYPNLLTAYNACGSTDTIMITSNQTTSGFVINKSITIQNGTLNPTVSIYLNSGFTIAANNVTFRSVKIYGANSSTARCIQINAGVNNFTMHGSTLAKNSTGSTGYGIYDLGSVNSGYYGTAFSGTTVGMYAQNLRGLSMHYGNAYNSFNNPGKNMYIKRAGGYTGDMGGWIEAVNFYTNGTNSVCFHAYNNYPGVIPWYWIEGCSFQAWGTGAKCTKSETTAAMNAINLQSCDLIHCQ